MSFYLWGVFKGSRANCLDRGVGEGESSIEKQKSDNIGTSKCNGSKDANFLTDGFCCQVHDLNDCSTVAGNLKQVHDLNDCSAVEKNLKLVHDLNECSTLAKNLISENFGNGITAKGMESAERYLFPVYSQDSKELKTGDSSVPWRCVSSLKNEFTCDAGLPVPDLELALGAETKSASKGISFWVDQSKLSSTDTHAPTPKEKEEDDPSASLSLSLSFPFLNEERGSVKQFPKEKLLHEGTL